MIAWNETMFPELQLNLAIVESLKLMKIQKNIDYLSFTNEKEFVTLFVMKLILLKLQNFKLVYNWYLSGA